MVKVAPPPYFWIAPKGFLGIDSALVLEKKIYAFQVTLSHKHKPPTKGMKILRDHLPGELKNLPWNVVFVGDSDSPIREVATSVGKTSFPTSDGESVPIAWSMVDPVRSNIEYTVRKFG